MLLLCQCPLLHTWLRCKSLPPLQWRYQSICTQSWRCSSLQDGLNWQSIADSGITDSATLTWEQLSWLRRCHEPSNTLKYPQTHLWDLPPEVCMWSTVLHQTVTQEDSLGIPTWTCWTLCFTGFPLPWLIKAVVTTLINGHLNCNNQVSHWIHGCQYPSTLNLLFLPFPYTFS